MTIRNIQTPISGYETHRLDQLDQQRQETHKAKAPQTSSSDRISISDEGRVKATAFKSAQESDGVRPDKVADVKARIASGSYKVDNQDIATKLVQQELDVWG